MFRWATRVRPQRPRGCGARRFTHFCSLLRLEATPNAGGYEASTPLLFVTAPGQGHWAFSHAMTHYARRGIPVASLNLPFESAAGLRQLELLLLSSAQLVADGAPGGAPVVLCTGSTSIVVNKFLESNALSAFVLLNPAIAVAPSEEALGSALLPPMAPPGEQIPEEAKAEALSVLFASGASVTTLDVVAGLPAEQIIADSTVPDAWMELVSSSTEDGVSDDLKAAFQSFRPKVEPFFSRSTLVLSSADSASPEGKQALATAEWFGGEEARDGALQVFASPEQPWAAQWAPLMQDGAHSAEVTQHVDEFLGGLQLLPPGDEWYGAS